MTEENNIEIENDDEEVKEQEDEEDPRTYDIIKEEYNPLNILSRLNNIWTKLNVTVPSAEYFQMKVDKQILINIDMDLSRAREKIDKLAKRIRLLEYAE